MAQLIKDKGRYILLGFPVSPSNDLLLSSGEVLDVNIEVVDNKKISQTQRRFIFALCNDIANYIGNDKDYVRLMLQEQYCTARGVDVKSLSDCSMIYAAKLIDFIITWCISNEIPLTGGIISQYEYHFNEQQAYLMALKRVCVVCGRVHSDIHHVDHIGNGFNRNKISHIGKRALPLCRYHHTEAHTLGEQKFINKYHLTPFEIDKKMELFIKRGVIKIYEEDGKEKENG